jgi:hypothetical protein
LAGAWERLKSGSQWQNREKDTRELESGPRVGFSGKAGVSQMFFHGFLTKTNAFSWVFYKILKVNKSIAPVDSRNDTAPTSPVPPAAIWRIKKDTPVLIIS